MILRRHAELRLLWAGETVSMLGTTTSSLLMPILAVVGLHASAWWVGVLTAATWLPWLVVGLPAGAWVDRWSPLRTMVVADAVALLATLSVPIAWWYGVLGLGQLLLVAVASGTATVFFRPAYQKLLPQLVPTDDLVAANGVLQGSESAAQIGGNGIAGALVHLVGAATGLLVDAISYAVSAVCLLRLTRRRPDLRGRRPTTGEPMLASIRTGLRFVARDPYLRYFTWMGGLSNLGLTGYGALIVLFLIRQAGVSASTIGLLGMVTATGAVAGAALARPLAERLGTARATVVVQLVAGSTVLLIPLTGPGWGVLCYLIGQFTVALGVVAGNVIKGAFRQGYVPAALMGRVTTSAQLINFGTMPVAGLLAGWLGTAVGVRPTIAIMAGVHAFACLAVLGSPVRGRRDLPTAPADRATAERPEPSYR